ncbi:hypothetical protein HPP92_026732 [Vanilla planifolia]|uniref:Uncharacterized protein n=1 Tax=Vanilla planifolia TaxID=51239 RepID=A0A835PIC6_VANPL|nr:hypothetical protein HPP92_026732 [Vanilla planifolia]
MAYHYYYNNSRASSSSKSSPFPLHLCFFLLILLPCITFSWYRSYESALGSILSQIKRFLIASSFVLLLGVQLFSIVADGRWWSPDETHSGGSPWIVGLFLLVLFLMVSYQSSFHERWWFPLLGR